MMMTISSGIRRISIIAVFVPIHPAAARAVRSRVLRETLAMRSGTCDSGTARSFLISLIKQEIESRDVNQILSFKEGETIFMEMSQKYDMEMIDSLAAKSGFEIVRNFFDDRQYFVNSIWKLKI